MCFSPEGGRMIQAKPTRLKQDMLSYLKEQKALRPLISLPWPPQPPRALTLTLLTAPSVPSPFSPHNSLPRSVKEEPGSKAINHGSDFWWLIRSRGWEGATLSSLPPLPTLCSGARILPGLLQIARALSVKKKKVLPGLGRWSPETHPWPVFPALFLRWQSRALSVDKNHLLSRSDLGRDSVIPSPWSVLQAGEKELRRRRRRRRNWFSGRGHVENWTQMCSKEKLHSWGNKCLLLTARGLCSLNLSKSF